LYLLIICDELTSLPWKLDDGIPSCGRGKLHRFSGANIIK